MCDDGMHPLTNQNKLLFTQALQKNSRTPTSFHTEPCAFKGYTHCLMSGPMSFPDTLEMDLRNPDVDTSIWLHMWDWYFWEEAVLARLKSLLNTWQEILNVQTVITVFYQTMNSHSENPKIL